MAAGRRVAEPGLSDDAVCRELDSHTLSAEPIYGDERDHGVDPSCSSAGLSAASMVCCSPFRSPPALKFLYESWSCLG